MYPLRKPVDVMLGTHWFKKKTKKKKKSLCIQVRANGYTDGVEGFRFSEYT